MYHETFGFDMFDQSTGLRPFLLLGGHGSRLELEFPEYISTEESKWFVGIGLPNGRSVTRITRMVALR